MESSTPSAAEREAYNDLCAWTLSLRDGDFIHQHVVDAYMAQNAEERTKPIGVTFALVGLYLHLEYREQRGTVAALLREYGIG